MAEEPVKPKRRGRKPQPAALSMFEWALNMEQEREPVGAGRYTWGEAIADVAMASPAQPCVGPFLRFRPTACPCVRAFFVRPQHRGWRSPTGTPPTR